MVIYSLISDFTFLLSFFVDFFLLIDILMIGSAIARLKDEKEKVRLIKMRDPVLVNENSDNKMNWMSSVQLWTNQTKSVILNFFKILMINCCSSFDFD